MSRCSSSKTGIILLVSRPRQIFYTLLVSSCSLTIGMCLEWAWYMTDMLIEDYDNDDFHYTDKYRLKMIKSLVYFGAVVSAGPAAFFASLLGFKSVLVIGMMITTCGSLVIIYLSTTSIAFCIGRIMHGIGTGIVFVIVPNYAAEIAEPKLRCILTGLHNLNFITGMFLSHIASQFYVYSYINRGTVFMAAMNLLVLLVVDDPPYFRMKYEKQNCNPLHYILNIQDYTRSNICNNIYKSSNYRDSENSTALSNIFKEKRLYRPLMLNVCLICFQQFCGFVALTSKLDSIYKILPISEIMSVTVAISSLQITSSIIYILLDSTLGKKHLLTISGLGMAVVICLINISYDNAILDHDELCLGCFIAIYIFFYSIGYGPIPLCLMPVICPRNSRLWTSGVTVSLFALLNLINNQSSYENKCIFGVDIFLLIFTFVSAFGALFAHIFIRETKYCII